MTRAIEPTLPSRRAQAEPVVERYAGEVVYVFAFDVAYELTRQPIRQILGQAVGQLVVGPTKRSPRQMFFYRAQMASLPPVQRAGPRGPITIGRSVKLLPVGAISITYRVPFEVGRIDDLVDYHDLQFAEGTLQEEVRQLAEEIRRELLPFSIRPVERLADEEAYTVFCINSPLATADGSQLGGEAWLDRHRREVASLLTQEPAAERLSEQEVLESTGRSLSYYEHDLVVVDWDAALILDDPRNFDETLYIMELANLQLEELEAYDRILDDAVERAYRDTAARRPSNRAVIMHQLSEIRIDLARLSDELINITKFFGDWHLARIYQTISGRFHLPDWHRSIDEKLKTLDDLYQILKQDHNNRWMFILEVTIVLLFVIDLVMLFVGMK